MFSEKQIKEMISAGAQGEIAEALEGDISIGGDLSVTGDAEVGGDLQAKTLSQTQANWEMAITPALQQSAIDKGLTLTTIYNKLSLYGNILYIVQVNKINNPTESSVAVGADDNINTSITDVPATIGTKIIDTSGYDLTEESGGYLNIDRSVGAIMPSVGYASYRSVMLHNGANKISISLVREVAYNIPAGGSCIITSRCFLIIA